MGQLKTLLLILCLVNCYYEALGGSKYTDENRPYEFGFTIDGEQHRHEKKDENGIIMGEFGFITADGVYHVTVYATDENGNFKILSMKNIRVKPYPSAPNAGTRQGHSLTLPSSNVTPKTSLNTTNKAPSYKQELKAGPAKSCSSCSVPTTTTQPPQVFVSGNAPSHNQPVENEYYAQIPPNNNNFITEQRPVQANNNQNSFSDNRNQQNLKVNGQNYDTQTPNRQLYSQNESSRKPSIELDTPLLNNYPTNSGINDNNYQQRLIPNKGNQASHNNNNYQQNHRGSSDVLGGDEEKIGGNSNFPGQNYPQEVNDYGQPISSAEPIKSQNTFENYPNNIYDKRKLISAGQNYPSTSNDGQKDDNIKSVGINTYPSNKELSNGQIIAPKNSFKENRQPKSFRDILESVNPEQNFNAIGPNSGQNKELSGKPVLVAAQMQIVDKNTDIYHKNPGEIDGLPKGLNNNDIKQLLYTFNYTVGFHGHHEEGYTNGAKYGYYYVTGRNGVRTRVDYVADETGFHPKISQEMLDILSDDVPKPETERDEKYGLKGYEFKWLYYPVE